MKCFAPGMCDQADDIRTYSVSNYEECLNECLDDEECQWLTFVEVMDEEDLCYLFETCPALNTTSCDNCISSQRQCSLRQEGQ